MGKHNTLPQEKNAEQLEVERLLNASDKQAAAMPTQADLFVVMNMAHDWPVKDDVASMEHPIFALSKRPSTAIRTYSRGGKVLKIIPSGVGAPTIFDKDLMIYLISQITAAAKTGQPVYRRIRMNVTDFLRGTRRSTGGASYERVVDMCRRLRGTTIETNIKTTEEERTKGFGLIEDYEIISSTKNGKGALVVEVTISEWLWRSAIEFDILTLSPDYFSLTQALERRVYELARKHCGDQAWWTINVSLLKEKVGSDQSDRKWKQEVKAMAAADNLPDYRMALDETAKPNQVIFTTRNNQKLMAQANKMNKMQWVAWVLQQTIRT